MRCAGPLRNTQELALQHSVAVLFELLEMVTGTCMAYKDPPYHVMSMLVHQDRVSDGLPAALLAALWGLAELAVAEPLFSPSSVPVTARSAPMVTAAAQQCQLSCPGIESEVSAMMARR